MDTNSLDRFIEAQEHMYAIALEEIKNGEKRSHWMWYIFPQIRGLGMSSMAHIYGIAGLDEAIAYLAHPTLSARLLEISEALLKHKKKNPEAEIDYIHDESSLRALAEKENSVGFLFDGMGKDELFKTVIFDGALPRKTFSMGHAEDKRYYLECRKITL